MKKIKLCLLLSSLLTFAGHFSFGQTSATPIMATLTETGTVQLLDEQPLRETYELSAESFHFENDHQALNHFKNVNTNYVFYRPALNRGAIVMYIELQKEPTWTKNQWNDYLSEHKLVETTSTQPFDQN